MANFSYDIRFSSITQFVFESISAHFRLRSIHLSSITESTLESTIAILKQSKGVFFSMLKMWGRGGRAYLAYPCNIFKVFKVF